MLIFGLMFLINTKQNPPKLVLIKSELEFYQVFCVKLNNIVCNLMM